MIYVVLWVVRRGGRSSWYLQLFMVWIRVIRVIRPTPDPSEEGSRAGLQMVYGIN